MKRNLSILSTVLLFIWLASATPVSAKDNWTRVRSKNFVLIGNADEKAVRNVGTRLEQFREVFTQLFPQARFNTPVPTTVIVFKSDSSYSPFKPSANTAGYFQPGPDVNYITLTTEVRGEQDPFNVIFHEYVHLLIHNTMPNAPTWFDEGLAEYYSTFNIRDDQKVMLGKVISSHVFRLRETMMPLSSLIAVDHNSPYYNERDKQSIFYAESWALVHYLLLGNEQKRVSQLGVFVSLLDQHVSAGKAFQQAFGITSEQMDKELRQYIKRDSYPSMTGRFEHKVEFSSEMESGRLTEADAQAYLGDLLLHSNRADAEKYLQKALDIDANHAMGLSSLGIVRMRQGKSDEAKQLLERAVAANAENYLTHYYYAEALSRESMTADFRVSSFSPEKVKVMRAELKKAIELAPTFPDSYRLLAFINMVAHEQLDESVVLLKRALTMVPGDQQILFTLAQLYMNKHEFKSAKEILGPLAQNASEAGLRTSAKGMLDSLLAFEEQLARYAEHQAAPVSDDNPAAPRLTRRATGTPEAPADEDTPVNPEGTPKFRGGGFRAKREGEEQAAGVLVSIDCDAKGVTFLVQTKEKVLKVRSRDLTAVQFVSYTADIGGDIGCGRRNPANPVIISYRPPSEMKAKNDGEAVMVEFVPKEMLDQP